MLAHLSILRNFKASSQSYQPIECKTQNMRNIAITFNRIIDDIDRVSFDSRLPASHDKSAGFLTQIFCEVAIHFIPNLACVIFTVRKSVVFQILCHLNTQIIGYIII